MRLQSDVEPVSDSPAPRSAELTAEQIVSQQLNDRLRNFQDVSLCRQEAADAVLNRLRNSSVSIRDHGKARQSRLEENHPKAL